MSTVFITLAIVFVMAVGCGFAVWAAASFSGGRPGFTSLADNATGGDDAADTPSTAVDWNAVPYPGMDCGPFPVEVRGAPVAIGPDEIVRVTCTSGGGTPPDALFAYSVTSGSPGLVATLVPAAQGMVVDSVTASGTGLTVRLSGWSSPDVVQADPDVHRTTHWTEAPDGTFSQDT